jgi:hypothetical protein
MVDAYHVFIRVEGDKPLILHRQAVPPTGDQIARLGLSYWALDTDAYALRPLVIHVYYTGSLPDELARAMVNAAVLDFVDSLLSGWIPRGRTH